MFKGLDRTRIFFVSIWLFLSCFFNVLSGAQPVTPNVSPEAKALLELMYRISEKYTLMGQHNYPNTRDRNSRFAAKYIGKTPPVWSTDMGFAEDGDTDSYLARPDIVQEAIRQHKMGSLVTICWHAVPPTADEPVTFRPQRNADPDSLASVQGQLLDQQFADVLTPGTRLYKRWCDQVDSIAVYLKKLQQARVPVLWRPYHEMNGDWFWWGGRHGENGTKALYRQIFDRLVNVHKLDNLIWLWSVDRAHQEKMQYQYYYPGNEYLDVVSLDVYGSDFSQAYYDSLLALSQGKPMVLGEVGNPPTLEVLDTQPKWGLWVVWAGMARLTSKEQYKIYVDSPKILCQEDSAYWDVMAPYRAACGLPPLPVKRTEPVNFTGLWVLDEEKSKIDNFGMGNTPHKMSITHKNNTMYVESYTVVEWGDDRVVTDTLKLDGSRTERMFMNSPRITTASWTENGDTLAVDSTIRFTRGERDFEMTTNESWSLQYPSDILTINQTTDSRRGKRTVTLVYKKW